MTVARDEVLDCVARSTESIWLSSPYLSAPIAEAINDRAPKGPGIERRLLTALTERSVRAGVLDVTALRLLRDAGWELRSIPNLHAKAVMADGREALIGSANLTIRGLGGGNLELGTWLPDTAIPDVRAQLAKWWAKADPIGEPELVRAEALLPYEVEDEGWSVGQPVRVATGRSLQATHRLREASPGTGYWLKAMYHGGPAAPPDWWEHQRWINDAHGRKHDGSVAYTVAGEPKRRPGYRTGDLIALYLVGPRILPAIYEVVSEPRFDVPFVRRHWPADAGTYGWVTDVALVLRVDPQLAPSLSATGIPGQALQGGRKRLSVAEFEAIREMIMAAK